MDNYNWGKFHDWKIGQIIVDWTAAKVSIFLRFETELLIKFNKFKVVSIPRQLPWGMSLYINSIKCEKVVDNWELNIELQSGDIISVVGEQIELNEQIK